MIDQSKRERLQEPPSIPNELAISNILQERLTEDSKHTSIFHIGMPHSKAFLVNNANYFYRNCTNELKIKIHNC